MLQKYPVMQSRAKRIRQYVDRTKKEANKIENASVRKSFINICRYLLVNPLECGSGVNARQETSPMKEEMLTGGIKCLNK